MLARLQEIHSSVQSHQSAAMQHGHAIAHQLDFRKQMGTQKDCFAIFPSLQKKLTNCDSGQRIQSTVAFIGFASTVTGSSTDQ